jgi:hypothetical protein
MRIRVLQLARLAALAILIGVCMPVRQMADGTAAHAAPQQTGLAIRATPTVTAVVEGGRAGLFVHSGANAALTLTIQYARNGGSAYTGRADRQGRYVFSWTVPLGQRLSGTARLRVDARRGTLSGSWSGVLAVRPAPLPPLFVQPLAPRFMAGTAMGVFVSTTPGAALSYRLVADGGMILARGGGIADAQGRFVISEPDSFLPKHAVGVTARVMVASLVGVRTRTAHFLLTPRPPLGLYVAATTQAVRAGETVGVFISSVPGTHLTVTLALTSTIVARGAGVADRFGRWVYSTQLYVALKHPVTAHVQVQAVAGVDRATGATTFLLKPGPAWLRPGALDRLASAANPPPKLSAYFSAIPEKVIMISTESQTLRAYEHGSLVHESYVTTGRPELPTVHGIFHVYLKQTPFEFISPWPPGSPYWYPPSWVRYWMPFYAGYGLHDAPWRTVYGPGTNVPHSSDPGEPLGTHGCVNIPLPDMVWLWNWTTLGTSVVVY